MSKALITNSTLTDIADAIRAKGGTSATMLPSAMPAAIAAIPSGGTWTKPPEWPDLPAILAADAASANPHGTAANVPNRIAVCVFAKTSDVFKCENINESIYYEEGIGYTGNGTVVSGYRTGFSFASEGYHWMIFYGTNRISTVGLQLLLNGASRCLWVFGDSTKDNYIELGYNEYPYEADKCVREENIGGVLSASYAYFYNNSNMIEEVKNARFVSANTTNYIYIFTNAYSLKRVYGEVGVTSESVRSIAGNILSGCYSLERMPDYLVVAGSNGVSGLANMVNLKELPKVMTPNLLTASAITYDFSKSPMIKRESLAVFENGEITGGFAAFQPVPTGEGWYSEGMTSSAVGAAGTRTIKFSEAVRMKFNATEQAAIATAFTNHGWTITW